MESLCPDGSPQRLHVSASGAVWSADKRTRRTLTGCFAIPVGATPVGECLIPRRMSLPGNAMAKAIPPGEAFGHLTAGLTSALPPALGPADDLATRAFPRCFPEA